MAPERSEEVARLRRRSLVIPAVGACTVVLLLGTAWLIHGISTMFDPTYVQKYQMSQADWSESVILGYAERALRDSGLPPDSYLAVAEDRADPGETYVLRNGDCADLAFEHVAEKEPRSVAVRVCRDAGSVTCEIFTVFK